MQDCIATCVAECKPKNSYVNPQLESGELKIIGAKKWEPSCKAVVVRAYNDQHCYDHNDGETKTRQDFFNAAMEDRGSCKTTKKNNNVMSYRYYCTGKTMRYTEWDANNCLGDASRTYVYKWNTCEELGNGQYIYVQGAHALKSVVVAAALALFAVNN